MQLAIDSVFYMSLLIRSNCPLVLLFVCYRLFLSDTVHLCPLTCANQMEESGRELLTREQRLASAPIRSSFMGSISNRPLSLLAWAVLMISKSQVCSDETATPFEWNVLMQQMQQITPHTHKHYSFVICFSQFYALCDLTYVRLHS